jgi:predicted ATPase/DNA-binding CsgD family transcriptional regulator
MFVAERHLLLILDNCEHLVEACAQLTDTLLRASSTMRLLATSREPLRIPGELTWRVPSLGVPAPDTIKEPAELVHYSAVQLFVDRAQAVQPTFSVTSDNAAAVAAISARLEGLPLAIQLAAAWVRVLGIEQVLQRLDATFRSNLGGNRGAPGRQQTMWATLDWSYALLDEPERALLRRLAVFAGGWSLEAAESVCAGGAIERGQVLEHLTRLVDSSLVHVQERAGYARFRLLEPVRVYAAEHLAASGEETSTRQAHAAAFLALGEQLSDRTRGWMATGQRLDRLELEHDNFRAALRWSVESGSIELGVRIAAVLGSLWLIRGHFSEGRGWIASLMDAPGSNADPPALARALGQAGNLTWYEGDPVTARRLHERALILYGSIRDSELGIAAILDALGLDAQSHGDYADAESFFEDALARARSHELLWIEMQALYHLGLVACDRMDYTHAQDCFEQARSVAARLGDGFGMARAFNGLGLVAHARGDYLAAQRWHQLGLEKRRELREPWGEALALGGLAAVLLDVGDLDRARNCLVESISLSQELGDRRGLAHCLEAFACVAVREGQPEQALRLVGAAEALRDTSELPLSPPNRLHLERYLEPARRALGEASAAALRASGYAMSVDEAVAMARTRGEVAAPTGTQHDVKTSDGASVSTPLTQRQHEVALLVGQGLTNRQIAGRLVVTERTAAAHIEHILDKLGFTSRTQIAAWVAGNVPADAMSR